MKTEALKDISQIDRETIARFSELRRRVYETQIHPGLQAKVAWLNYEQPTGSDSRDGSSTVPNTEGLIPGQVASVLSELDKSLATIISEAENEHSHGSYGFGIYETVYVWGYGERQRKFANDLGLMLPLNIRNGNWRFWDSVDGKTYDKAVNLFFQNLQGELSLKPAPTWEEAVALVEQAGGKAPEPPDAILYELNQDPGPLNDNLSLVLPTKAPHLFVSYWYKAHGKHDGVASVSKFPQYIGIKATTLDEEYPRYPYQRFS